MEMFNSRRIANIGIVGSIYIVITIIGSGFSYDQIQFRISEALILLCYFNKDYIISMTLGCLITNMSSPLGPIDMLVGTAATLIAAVLIYICRNKVPIFVTSLFPLINALFIAVELKIVSNLPLLVSMGWIALGEFVCVSILGVVLMKALSKNKHFMKLIMSGQNTNK